MTQLVPIETVSTSLSPLMKKRMAEGTALSRNFADGVRDAFPLLSIKGKVFRARISGQETAFLDPATKQPMAYLDLVLVNGSKNLSKSYYSKGFVDGDFDPPQCWSMDSYKPDPSVAQKVSPTCQNCPMNQFGSRVTPDGKQAKACSDARRVAVVMPHQLQGDDQLLMLLRIPQGSLKNLKNYAELLMRHGVEPAGCITRLTFDYNEAFPKLIFNFVAPLPEALYEKSIEIADGPLVTSMLHAPDFEQVASTNTQANATEDNIKGGGIVQQTAPVLGSVLADAGPELGAVAQGAADDIINLPNGMRFNKTKGVMVTEPEPVEEDEILDLPNGMRFNKTKGIMVEAAPAAAAVVEKAPDPVLDPNVLSLPNGQFFNQNTAKFVTGPYVGDADMDAAPVAPTEPAKKKRRTSAEVAAEKAAKEAADAGVQVRQTTLPDQAVTDQLAALTSGPDLSVVDNSVKPDLKAAPANDTNPTVSAAPASLENMLAMLVPAKT